MFSVYRSPHFERDITRLARKNRDVVFAYEEGLTILSTDPYNHSRTHRIKKLSDIKQG